MFSLTATAALNHLLASESWARDALKSFAGKTASISVPPLTLRLTVLPDGMLAAADAASIPEVRISLPPGLLVAALRQDQTVFSEARIEGDTGFAKTIQWLFRNLRWDFEEDLSRVTGDIVAHRIATSARSFFAWQRRSVEKLLQNIAEYCVEEAELLAKSDQIAIFLRQVDELRDDSERLGKRIDRLLAGKRVNPS